VHSTWARSSLARSPLDVTTMNMVVRAIDSGGEMATLQLRGDVKGVPFNSYLQYPTRSVTGGLGTHLMGVGLCHVDPWNARLVATVGQGRGQNKTKKRSFSPMTLALSPCCPRLNVMKVVFASPRSFRVQPHEAANKKQRRSETSCYPSEAAG
jgi:hypothetical protein